MSNSKTIQSKSGVSSILFKLPAGKYTVISKYNGQIGRSTVVVQAGYTDPIVEFSYSVK